jgi:hypothetical protein
MSREASTLSAGKFARRIASTGGHGGRCVAGADRAIAAPARKPSSSAETRCARRQFAEQPSVEHTDPSSGGQTGGPRALVRRPAQPRQFNLDVFRRRGAAAVSKRRFRLNVPSSESEQRVLVVRAIDRSPYDGTLETEPHPRHAQIRFLLRPFATWTYWAIRRLCCECPLKL